MNDTKTPNAELAVELLAGGADEKTLRRFAAFPSLRVAREFMSDVSTQRAVDELVRHRSRRVGALAISKLEAMLKDTSLDGRTAVAAIRTGLEVSGLMRKDGLPPPSRPMAELSVAELNELISETKAELERLKAKRSVN